MKNRDRLYKYMSNTISLTSVCKINDTDKYVESVRRLGYVLCARQEQTWSMYLWHWLSYTKPVPVLCTERVLLCTSFLKSLQSIDLNRSPDWLSNNPIVSPKLYLNRNQYCCRLYRGADKSLARLTSQCILFYGVDNSFDASLVIYINSTIITPIMNINRINEHQNLLSLYLVSFLVGLRTYQHPCRYEMTDRTERNNSPTLHTHKCQQIHAYLQPDKIWNTVSTQCDILQLGSCHSYYW
jgi:hypothetical protein